MNRHGFIGLDISEATRHNGRRIRKVRVFMLCMGLLLGSAVLFSMVTSLFEFFRDAF